MTQTCALNFYEIHYIPVS